MRKYDSLGWLYLFLCAVLAVALALMVVDIASAAPSEDRVCQPRDAHIHPGEGISEVTATAAEGQLIEGYCVKAGSANQGFGPEYVTLDSPVRTVTISHSSGKDISHFVVFFTDAPPTTTTTEPPSDSTTTTTTPVVPSTTTTEVPGQSTTTAPPESPHDPPPSSDSADPVPAQPKLTG